MSRTLRAAASVSFMDCLLVSGQYQMKPPTPFVPETDGAGIVQAVGDGVTRVKPGDRVACSDWTGAYAQTMAVPEHQVTVLPMPLTSKPPPRCSTPA